MRLDLTRRGMLAALAAASCGKKASGGYHGWAFVALQGDRPSLAAVDLNDFVVRRRISLPATPVSVFPNPTPASGTVLTLLPKARQIAEVDARTLTVHRTLQLPATPVAVKPSFDKQRLWCLNTGPDALQPLDLVSGSTAAGMPLPGRPVSWDLHPREDLAAIALAGGELLLADLRKQSLRRLGSAGADPGPIAFRSDGRAILAADRANRQLRLYETDAAAHIVDLPLSLRPDRFCMLANGGQLFITGVGQDAVVIAYPYRTEIAQTTLSGRRPADMATSDQPPFLFVSNPDAGSVTVFSISSQKVVAVTGVGIQPGAMAVTPDQRYALVLHGGSGDLGVIRIESITARRAKSAPLFTMIPIGERPVGLAIIPTPTA
jgi:hypothetical protein